VSYINKKQIQVDCADTGKRKPHRGVELPGQARPFNLIFPFLSSSTALDVSHLELETCHALGKIKRNLPIFLSFWFPFPDPTMSLSISLPCFLASLSPFIHFLPLEETTNNIMYTFFMSFYSLFNLFFLCCIYMI